jgi:hypothetical protein
MLKVLPPVTYTEGIPEWMKLRIHSVYVQGVKHPVDGIFVCFSICCCRSSLFFFRLVVPLATPSSFVSIRPLRLTATQCAFVCVWRLGHTHTGVAPFLPPSYLICAASVCVCVCGFVSLAYKKKGETARSGCHFSLQFVRSDEKINTLREKENKKTWKHTHMV